MRYFPRRRLTNSVVTLAVVGVVAGLAAWRERRLESADFLTGWILLGAVGFLALFQLRKKIPAPPLGSAAAWLQVHIYTGLGTAAVFWLHTHGRWPTGRLDAALAALYAATFASGVIGLYWTRTLPRRLRNLADEVIYERIPALRGGLREQAQAAVLAAVRTAGGATLGEFYQARLHDYFSTRRGWRYRLHPTSAHRKTLLAELTDLTRYLSESERRTAEELFALVRRRDDLDYHEALQWRLRVWLFVHIALTYPLLAAASLHAWLAHVFSGAAA